MKETKKTDSLLHNIQNDREFHGLPEYYNTLFLSSNKFEINECKKDVSEESDDEGTFIVI